MEPHSRMGIRVRGCRILPYYHLRKIRKTNKTDFGPIEVTYIKKTWWKKFKIWLGKAWKKLYQQGKRG